MQKLFKTAILIILCAAAVFCLAACTQSGPEETPAASVPTDAPVTEPTPDVDSPEATPAPEETPAVQQPATITGYDTDADEEGALAVFPLDDRENQIRAAVEGDITVISEEEYPQRIWDLINNLGAGYGQLFQLEGEYQTVNGVPYVIRSLLNGEEETFAGLPLTNLNKSVARGAWIRVMGILNAEDVDGRTVNALQVLSIEGLEEPGQAQLQWTGLSN